MSRMMAWPPIRKISVYRWPRMLSKRMSFDSASSCGSLADSSFMARPPYLLAGLDKFLFSRTAASDRGGDPARGSVHLFDRRAFPFRLDHLGPGEVHAQDREPFAVVRAGKPVRFFFFPG